MKLTTKVLLAIFFIALGVVAYTQFVKAAPACFEELVTVEPDDITIVSKSILKILNDSADKANCLDDNVKEVAKKMAENAGKALDEAGIAAVLKAEVIANAQQEEGILMRVMYMIDVNSHATAEVGKAWKVKIKPGKAL